MTAFSSLWASKASRFLAAAGSACQRKIGKSVVESHRYFSTLYCLRISDRMAAAASSGGAKAGFSTNPGSGAGGGLGGEIFQLSSSSVLKLQKGDITVWFADGSTDAIVNAANERMLGGGGVDGAIHRAAGPELLKACRKVPEVRPGIRCPTGEARITPAFCLPVSHVIHTVGPIYDLDTQPNISLANAYRNSLKLAKENNILYIAFPAISCGVYGYPYKEGSKIAISTVNEFQDAFKEVHFVLFSDELYNIWVESARELL